MANLDVIAFLTPGALGAAIEVTVASIASPTELNSRAAAQGDIILARTIEAGTGTQTWYYADTTSAVEALPYIVSSATAGVKFIAFGGRYQNENINTAALTASRVVTTDASKNLDAPATIATDQSLSTTSTVASKQTAAAGISLDHNSATGNFTFRFSPANLTANRSATWSDADYVFTGGGTVALGGFTLTVPATGTTALLGAANTFSAVNTYSSAASSTSPSSGAVIVTGGVGIGQNLNVGGNASRFGNNAGAVYVRVDGGDSGSDAGGYISVWNNGSSKIIFGNKSAVLGGAYNGTPYFYSNGTIEFADSIQMTDGKNFVLTTTTGTKFGTSTSQKMAWWNATPVVQQTVTGSRGGNAALADLLTKLATYGIIVDSTSA